MELNRILLSRIFCGLVAGVILAVTCAASDDPKDDRKDAEYLAQAIQIRLQLEATSYVGLPCIAQISATWVAPPPKRPEALRSSDDILQLSKEERAEWYRQGALSGRLFPAFTPLTTEPLPISISVLDAEGRERLKHGVVSRGAFEGAPRHYRLPSGGSIELTPQRPKIHVTSGDPKTWCFDLSPWLATLEPGHYSLAVRLYSSPEHWWESPRQSFELATLGESNWKIIRAARPTKAAPADQEGNTRIPASDWLNPAIDHGVLHTLLPNDAWSNVAFYVLMAKAAAAQLPDDLPADLLQSLPPRLEPIADVIRYELLLNVPDELAAAAIRDRFKEHHAELLWLLDRAQERDGLIAQSATLRPKE